MSSGVSLTLVQLFVIVCTKPRQRSNLTLGGISERLNSNYSCIEVMEGQIDKLWDAILTNARFQFIACLTINKTSFQFFEVMQRNKGLQSEECHLSPAAALHLYSARSRLLCAVAIVSLPSKSNYLHKCISVLSYNACRETFTVSVLVCLTLDTHTPRIENVLQCLRGKYPNTHYRMCVCVSVCVCVCRSISGLVPAVEGAADSGVFADGHGVGEQVGSGTPGRQILHQTQQRCVHTGHAPTTAHTGITHTHSRLKSCTALLTSTNKVSKRIYKESLPY